MVRWHCYCNWHCLNFCTFAIITTINLITIKWSPCSCFRAKQGAGNAWCGGAREKCAPLPHWERVIRTIFCHPHSTKSTFFLAKMLLQEKSLNLLNKCINIFYLNIWLLNPSSGHLFVTLTFVINMGTIFVIVIRPFLSSSKGFFVINTAISHFCKPS